MAVQASTERLPLASQDRSPVLYRRATDPVCLDEIFRLRYRCYRAEGTIEVQPSGRFFDAHDEDPNVFVFGVEHENVLAGSIRMHVCSAEMPFAPGLEVFPEILQPLIERGESFVDPTRFVVDRSLRAVMGQMPFATVRLAAMAAEHFRADHVLATVRAEHVPFYRRFCDMELLTEPRNYPGLKKPICLMSGRSVEISRSVYARYPHFSSMHRERIRLFGLSRMIGLGMTDTPVFNDNRNAPARDVALAVGGD